MVSFFVPPMIIYGKNQSGGAGMGYFLALAAVFFWSFNLIVASYFATTLMPFEIAFGRWLVASLILVPAAWAGIKQNYRLLLDNWPLIATLAVTGIVLDNPSKHCAKSEIIWPACVQYLPAGLWLSRSHSLT